MNKLIISALVVIIFSPHAIANSNFGSKNVTQLIFHDSGNLYVYFSGNTIHTESCDSKTTYVLPRDNVFFKEMYSGLLAAMHSGTKVNGWVNGCVNVWGKTKPRITRLDFKPKT